MSNHYSEAYGDDPIVSVLGNKDFMLVTWLAFTASAGMSAFWIGGRFGADGHIALWALFAERLIALAFGLYRSLFYNFLCGLAVGTAIVLSVLGVLGSDMDSMLIGLCMLAMLMGCFACTGGSVVLSMLAQSWSEKRKIASTAAR
jgi:hypothetical protein